MLLTVYRPVSMDWVNEFPTEICPTISRIYPNEIGRKTAKMGAKRNFSISSEALVNAI